MLNLSHISPSRYPVFQDASIRASLTKIAEYVQQDINHWHTIFPSQEHIFQAFELTSFEDVKVVIIGQDPYHGPHQAHWLTFSVFEDAKIPPSLRNIYKELRQEWFANYQHNSPLLRDDGTISGHLARRATQWVLLLNAILSVRASQAWSHRKIGREDITDRVISELSQKRSGIAFLLWWNFAKSKRPLIDESKHLVLTAVHPSPLSAHQWWFGNNHFRQANEYLQQHWKKPILR